MDARKSLARHRARRLRWLLWRHHVGLPIVRRGYRRLMLGRGHAPLRWRVPGCPDCCVRRALRHLTDGLDPAATDRTVTAILSAPLGIDVNPSGSKTVERQVAQTAHPAQAGEPR